MRNRLSPAHGPCLIGLLALASCKDDPSDPLENVGGTSTAGSAGANQAGAGGSGTGGSGMGGSGGGTGGTSAGDGGITPVPGLNLIPDPGFEAGTQSWLPMGSCILERATNVARTGSASMLVKNRTEPWQGAGFDIVHRVAPGATYEFRAWIRPRAPVDGGPQAWGSATVTLQRRCAVIDSDTDSYTPLVTRALEAGWVELTATFTAPTCELERFMVFVEGLAVGVDYYLDDASFAAKP